MILATDSTIRIGSAKEVERTLTTRACREHSTTGTEKPCAGLAEQVSLRCSLTISSQLQRADCHHSLSDQFKSRSSSIAVGLSCESFGLGRTSTSDCLAGHYCVQAVGLRSPVKAYAGEYASSIYAFSVCTNEICQEIKTQYAELVYHLDGMEKLWSAGEMSDSGLFNGDVCQPGHYCPSGSRHMHRCKEGHFCPEYFMKEFDQRLRCQAGFYCSEGSGTATPGNPFYSGS